MKVHHQKVQRTKNRGGQHNYLLLALGLATLGGTTFAIAQPAQAFSVYQNGYSTATSNSPVPFAGSAADTARNNFLTSANALGTTNLEGFENTTQTNFYQTNGTGTWTRSGSNLSITVTNGASGSAAPNNGIIAQTTSDQAYGFNTTAGGSQLLRISSRTSNPQTSISFSFTSGVKAFGIFVTDYGNSDNSQATLQAFVNGSSTRTGSSFTRYNNSGSSTYRSVQFFGITQQSGDPLITSVTFNLSGVSAIDRFGFDDVYTTTPVIAPPSPKVPVPPQALGSAMFAGVAFLRKKKQPKVS